MTMDPEEHSRLVSDIFCVLNVSSDENLWSTLSDMPDEYLVRCYELLARYAARNGVDVLESTPESKIIADCWDFLDHFEDDDYTSNLIGIIESAPVLVAYRRYKDPILNYAVWRSMENALADLDRCFPLDNFKAFAQGFMLSHLVSEPARGKRYAFDEAEKEHLKWLTANADILFPLIPQMIKRKSTDRGYCEALLESHTVLAEGSL